MRFTGITTVLRLFGKTKRDCDFYDKLNHRYTAYFLIALGLVFFAREYIADPIDCWGKPHWAGSWGEYAEDYCLVEGTFFVELNKSYNHDVHFEKENLLRYYQWIPFTFVFLGMFMMFPSKIWDVINWSSTLHMSAIIHSVDHKQFHCPRKFSKAATSHIRDVIRRTKCHQKLRLLGKFNFPYLSTGYMTVKILNILVTLAVFYLLTYFLAEKANSTFGISIVTNILKGVNWRKSGAFPRITVCKFYARRFAYIEKESSWLGEYEFAPCVLTANMLAEAFYIFSYIALCFVQLMNIYSIIKYLKELTSESKVSFIENLVEHSVDLVWPPLQSDPKFKELEAEKHKDIEDMDKLMNTVINTGDELALEKAKEDRKKMLEAYEDDAIARIEKRDSKREEYMKQIDFHIKDFVGYLGSDNILLIRLLSTNSNPAFTGALVGRLFWKYCKDQEDATSHGADNNNNEP